MFRRSARPTESQVLTAEAASPLGEDITTEAEARDLEAFIDRVAEVR